MQSRSAVLIVALLALGASAAAQSSIQTREVLTNRAVVTLAGAGFNEDFVIELILNSRTQFDTSVSGLAGLAKQGINERIIRVMLSSIEGTPVVTTSELQPFATASIAPPFPEIRPKVVVLKPRATALAISTHTPYYSSMSFFWGLLRKKVGVGAAPQPRDVLAPHLGLVYDSVLSPRVLPIGYR
jgi:hypothetical protein